MSAQGLAQEICAGNTSLSSRQGASATIFSAVGSSTSALADAAIGAVADAAATCCEDAASAVMCESSWVLGQTVTVRWLAGSGTVWGAAR